MVLIGTGTGKSSVPIPTLSDNFSSVFCYFSLCLSISFQCVFVGRILLWPPLFGVFRRTSTFWPFSIALKLHLADSQQLYFATFCLGPPSPLLVVLMSTSLRGSGSEVLDHLLLWWPPLGVKLSLWTCFKIMGLLTHLYEVFMTIWIQAFMANRCTAFWALKIVVFDFMLLFLVIGLGGLFVFCIDVIPIVKWSSRLLRKKKNCSTQLCACLYSYLFLEPPKQW